MSCIETPEAPAWLSRLENQREKLSKGRLGHDSGAGAACNTCGSDCPGLDLHFWRKVCRACKCHKDAHDVQNDELSGWAHFELLGKSKPKITKPVFMRIQGIADEPVKLDWVPPNASPDLVSDYMSCLGGDLAPVAGSEGAVKRREQLRRQIPTHDIRNDLCSYTLTPQEQDNHKEYVSRIKSSVVGLGNIVRVGNIGHGDIHLLQTEESQPVHGVKSYSLPLKLTSLNTGVKYNCVPKNTSDKHLDLDSRGNVINKSALYADYKSSPLISAAVKDKLNDMRIESDRIISAVEHGPVYDKLFKDLKQLNTPLEADVYLCPIKKFRMEYLCNPKFKDETKAFAESQGAKIMHLSPNVSNNNGDIIPQLQKGTIFAPNGEIWSWTSTEQPTKSNALNSLIDTDDDVPPLPNYSTHPTMRGNPSIRDLPINYGTMSDGEPTWNTANDSPNKNSYQATLVNPDVDSLGRDVGSMSLKPYKETDCSRCSKPIQSGDVAVQAKRAGDNVAWHPQCFTCCKCRQLLVDLIYFYHKGEIYCGRDFADVMKISRCAACDELIFSRLYTIAEGKTFHPQHFCCYYCDTLLGDKSYVPDDNTGLPACLECYDKYLGAKCHSCKQVIGPAEPGVSFSNCHWHQQCFNCSSKHCNKSLIGGRFKMEKEMPFCSRECVLNTFN